MGYLEVSLADILAATNYGISSEQKTRRGITPTPKQQ